MDLFIRAAQQITDNARAKLDLISRHRVCIERVDHLADSLKAAGFGAFAGIDGAGHLFIGVPEISPDLINAIERSGHTAVPASDGAYQILPPLRPEPGLSVTLTTF